MRISENRNPEDMHPFVLLSLGTTKELDLQEQLRRERMRLFTSGISSYSWFIRGKSQNITRHTTALSSRQRESP